MLAGCALDRRRTSESCQWSVPRLSLRVRVDKLRDAHRLAIWLLACGFRPKVRNDSVSIEAGDIDGLWREIVHYAHVREIACRVIVPPIAGGLLAKIAN